ncbi:MAG: hypothetical protein Q8O00_00305 [Holophaga sp.]|nr:hypothetical protein [Holophaga sp.]
MKVSRLSALFATTLVLMTGVACTNKKSVTMPTKKVAAGTAHFQFARKVQGPLELTLDGIRVPVEPTKKNKKARALMITGLTPGKHRFFLYSPRDAFGPDQGEFEIAAGNGAYVMTFAQAFNAVLYGKPDALAPAEGIPGVRAYLVP